MPTPRFDEHFGFLQRLEDLTIEQLISQLAIERLRVSVGLRRQMHPMAMNRYDVSGLRTPSIRYWAASLRS